MTPQNLHTHKFSFFWKPEKTEIKNFEPKKITRAYVCMKISEYHPPGDSLQNYDTKYHFLFNIWRSQSWH